MGLRTRNTVPIYLTSHLRNVLPEALHDRMTMLVTCSWSETRGAKDWNG